MTLSEIELTREITASGCRYSYSLTLQLHEGHSSRSVVIVERRHSLQKHLVHRGHSLGPSATLSHWKQTMYVDLSSQPLTACVCMQAIIIIITNSPPFYIFATNHTDDEVSFRLFIYYWAIFWPRILSSFTKADLASFDRRAFKNPKMIFRCFRFNDFQFFIWVFNISFWVGRSPIVISYSQKDENYLEGSSFCTLSSAL